MVFPEASVRLNLRFDRSHCIGQMGHFLERNECGAASIVAFQAIDARLCRRHGVHHDIVQSSATRGDGNIVLGIDTAQVTLQTRNR